MRKLVLLLLLTLGITAQARTFSQAELDALLAPIALHPDAVVNHVMIAAAYPDQVAEAARGAPAAPHWHPSVSELLPYPELLQRMAESPQWMRDLSAAFIGQQAAVLQTVEALRARAQNYAPIDPGPGGVVYGPSAGYVRYYDPLVVYGPWWWPGFVPVVWHSWHVHRPLHPHHHHHHGFHHHSHVIHGRSHYRPGSPVHSKPHHLGRPVQGPGVRHAPSLPRAGHSGPKPGHSGPKIQHRPQSIAGSGGGGFLQKPQSLAGGSRGMPSARGFSGGGGGPSARGFNGGGGGARGFGGNRGR